MRDLLVQIKEDILNTIQEASLSPVEENVKMVQQVQSRLDDRKVLIIQNQNINFNIVVNNLVETLRKVDSLLDAGTGSEIIDIGKLKLDEEESDYDVLLRNRVGIREYGQGKSLEYLGYALKKLGSLQKVADITRENRPTLSMFRKRVGKALKRKTLEP